MKIRQRTSANKDQCQVCGDAAHYTYFGTLSCQACKMFFKRYGNNQNRAQICSSNGDCEINISTRHLCAACRLKKCLASGMEVHKIRRSTLVNPKKEKRKRKLSLQAEKNLLSSVASTVSTCVSLSDYSLLSSSQWCLLNNLNNIYDFSKIDTHIRRLNEIKHSKDVAFIRSIHSIVLREFLSSHYQAATIIWRNNRDFDSWEPVSDRSLLLSMAINNITCFLASYIFAQHNLYHNRYLVNHLSHLYGSNIVQCHQWTTSFAQLDDPILFKLFLVLFALSTVGRVNRSDLQQEFIHPKKIIDIEHRYAEVTWKYLVNKYKNYGEAVRRWMQMMRWLLSMSVLVYHSYDVKTHMNDIEEAIEEVEMSLILEEMDELIDGCT